MIKKLLNITLLFILTVPAWGASVNLKITPARGKNKIEVGDLFFLYINVSNAEEAPARPQLQGAKLTYFDQTAEQSSMSSVNGHTTMSYSATYTATFRAEKEGSYEFGPISVGGAKSNIVKYSIGKEMPSQSNSTKSTSSDSRLDKDSKPQYIGKGDANLFLRASVSTTDAFEQQAIQYTVKLYTTYDAIKYIGATDSPKFDGFVIEESNDISNSLTFETYNGKTYATAVIARYVIFPQVTGLLKVIGNKYTIAVDRREYYHDAFWGNMSYSVPLQLNVSPNDLIINVKNLPAPKPADFSGAVGNFNLTSRLGSSDFKSNEAASIIYKLTGTGNIKYVQLPDLSALYPSEIEIYSPKTTQDIKVGGSNVSGSVTYDYSFMPLEEGDFRIPDLKLVYFNPESGRYETTVAKGYDISVGKGKNIGTGKRQHLKFDSKLQQVNVSGLKKFREQMIDTFGFWLWFIIPVIILAGAFTSVRIYASRHADMVAFNSRRADKIARRRLRKAISALKKKNADLFYDELLSALWGYIGDKLKMPTSELLRDNIRQVLKKRRINDDATTNFIDIIDKAEFAKYSSADKSDEGMSVAFDSAVKVINALEKEFKKSPSK